VSPDRLTRMQELMRETLSLLGEDPQREGLVRTPERVAESFRFLTSGYRQDPDKLIQRALFEHDGDEMVVLRDIDLFSLCEHHMLPFFGKAHVAYIPNGKIVGLSKIPRVVEVFARRLQVQERLTQQIARCLEKNLQPKGVAVVIDALHLCMAMRGVEKQNAVTTTSAVLGSFREDRRTRAEFLELITNRARVGLSV
jgi:GTP cyclohydrolase I